MYYFKIDISRPDNLEQKIYQKLEEKQYPYAYINTIFNVLKKGNILIEDASEDELIALKQALQIDSEKIITTQIKPSLNGLIFDQPTSHRRNSKSSINIDIKIPNNRKKINNNNLFNEMERTVTEEIKPDDVKIDFMSKNKILTNEINHKDSFINNSNISLLKTQKKEEKEEGKKQEKENRIKQYQTQVKSENEKYVNYQFYYIEKPVTLVKFHSCNYIPQNEISNNNSNANYNKRKIMQKKDLILPKTINRRSLKKIITKIGNDHIKTHNY